MNALLNPTSFRIVDTEAFEIGSELPGILSLVGYADAGEWEGARVVSMLRFQLKASTRELIGCEDDVNGLRDWLIKNGRNRATIEVRLHDVVSFDLELEVEVEAERYDQC